MQIDRDSFTDCFNAIKTYQCDGGEPLQPMNPVLVYIQETGQFSIQSGMSPMNEWEFVLGADMTTNQGSPADEFYDNECADEWRDEDIADLVNRYSK